MIKSVVDLFEKIATNAHHTVVIEDLIQQQSAAIKQAISQHDSYAIKSLFCNPAELADKTTVFQS